MKQNNAGHPAFGKTFVKNIIRGIRLSFSRFAAIFAIVALGVGFLAGLLASTPDMEASVDRYFDQTAMMDLFIKADMGITGEDIRAVSSLEEVERVQAARVTDALVRTDSGESLTARIYGFDLERSVAGHDEGGFVNRMELLLGRMPEKDDECLAEQSGGFFIPLEPGAILRIEGGQAGDLPDTYAYTQFTVTGIVKSPLFLSYEREPSRVGSGRLGAVIYVREAAYTLPVYTDINLTLKGASKLKSFSPAYQDLIDSTADKLDSIGRERSALRRKDILRQVEIAALEKIQEAELEYEEGERTAMAEIEAARRRLNEGWAEFSRREAELAEGAERAKAGRLELENGRRQAERAFLEGEERLRSGGAELAAAKKQAAEGKAQLDAAKDEVEKTRKSFFKMLFSKARRGVEQYDESLAQYQVGMMLLAEKEWELEQGRRELEQGRKDAEREFAGAEAELAAAEEEIAAGRKALEEGRRELERGEAQWEAGRLEAERKLTEGKAEIEDGKRSIGDFAGRIETPRWYVLDRNSNVGTVNFKANAGKIADIAKVFPVFFLLVAALVALTTMTRMVEEERTQIGTLKALGYQKRIIAGKYLVYCGLTSVLGALCGMIGGFRLFPIIIYNAFGTMYKLPPLVTEFNWVFGLTACFLVLLGTMGAAASACYGALWEKPANLLLPRAPRRGKRILLEYIPFIWQPLKFTYKVTARNLIRYKKHFFMTISGIAGCTALMVAGFGLRESLVDIAHTQFKVLEQYDLRIELAGILTDPDGEAASVRSLADLLGRYGLSEGAGQKTYLPIQCEDGSLVARGGRISTALYTPKTGEDLGSYITLRDRKTKTTAPFSDTDVFITEKMAEVLGLKPGLTIGIENSGGRRGEFILTGVIENYVGCYVYIGRRAYTEVFGGDLRYGTLLVKSGIDGLRAQDELIRALHAEKNVGEASFGSQIQQSYENLLSSISFVVLILIAAAGALAMIVIYNLSNININERSRELATLRVLGFRQNEAAAYIFREIAVLSVLGALAGLVLGIPLHRFIIAVAENTDLMFGRTISAPSYILSALITLLFSAATDFFMLKKIRGIKMAESMKAAE
ncbi:MAG: FtsX-like permease family protein [Treponema sp.]|nr:FtsX-like permease family protein [Treponema sp.]